MKGLTFNYLLSILPHITIFPVWEKIYPSSNIYEGSLKEAHVSDFPAPRYFTPFTTANIKGKLNRNEINKFYHEKSSGKPSGKKRRIFYEKKAAKLHIKS